MTRIDRLPTFVAGAGSAALACLLTVTAACAPAGGSGAEPAPRASVGNPAAAASDAAASDAAADRYIRVNQLGYLPGGRKVAVVCDLEATPLATFTVVDEAGRTVLGPEPTRAGGAFGPCASTHRLDFSALRTEGRYRIRIPGHGAGGGAAPGETPAAESPEVRIAADAYHGAADFLLRYMRQQRSGYNPFFGDSVHHRTDAILVDHPTRAGEWIPVAGGWADAADYLQYGTTSANATFNLLLAWRDHPEAFGDEHQASGDPGANGVPDVLDEARHGLEWILALTRDEELLLHQIGDDRDHAFPDLPTTDSSDYGWGRGGPRPVYPCTGKPQGLFQGKNRSAGKASIAGKYAAALALGARLLADRDPAFAQTLADRAQRVYELGRDDPGPCQTAPGRSPYFYEEESWVDDMELAAAELHALTGDDRYRQQAVEYARMEPVTPWMGQDTARHYEFFPWHNPAHYEIARYTRDTGDTGAGAGAGADEAAARQAEAELMAEFYRRGLERVADRADNGFLVGIPFIWCSNNLMASYATQALLYRRMTGDTTFLPFETAALDWLLGTNPWGTSMIVGLPLDGVWPRDPHSIVALRLGVEGQFGGLVDGPVYRSIYENLLGIRLHEPDEFAPFNTGFIVYHDDMGDYSTNEPIMDGTANLAYLFAAMATDPWRRLEAPTGGRRATGR